MLLLAGTTTLSIAHNGSVGYAYPIGPIVIDGDLRDWTDVKKVTLGLSDEKHSGENDFSAFFQFGYNLVNKSIYLAFEITDDDYIRDSSKNVRWNTQDALEFYLDLRHSPVGSGLASYLISKDFKNINNTAWDPVAKTASWDQVEYIVRRQGHKTIYECRIVIGDQLVPGKSIGFDVQAFDKDSSDFTINPWGEGDYKFRNPLSLGDIIFMKSEAKLGSVFGNIHWSKPSKDKRPSQISLTSTVNKLCWVEANVDSNGCYTVLLPLGTYRASLPGYEMPKDQRIWIVNKTTTITSSHLANSAPTIYLASLATPPRPAPDGLAAKGILHDFNPARAKQLDAFIAEHQAHYQIPGVSLALIKDGKVVYHKTYGVKNTFTNIPVDANTLFEAASVTKPVFAYAVLRLMEKGIIDLDKPLYEYLPYDDVAHDERYKLITARHVLTHRTGFPNWRSMNADNKLNLKFIPGSDYNYSGEGFEYLKMVVEKITGKKVEQILQEEVLAPIGLYHTYFSKNDTLEKLVCTGHFDNMPSGDGLPGAPGMAYSMHTEAHVFTRFMIHLLNERGLLPDTYKDMLRVHSEYKYDKPEDKPQHHEYMGLSLNIRETPFGLVFGHGGNNGDFRCEFEVYKDLKMGYVLFTNGSGAYPMIEKMKSILVEGK